MSKTDWPGCWVLLFIFLPSTWLCPSLIESMCWGFTAILPNLAMKVEDIMLFSICMTDYLSAVHESGECSFWAYVGQTWSNARQNRCDRTFGSGSNDLVVARIFWFWLNSSQAARCQEGGACQNSGWRSLDFLLEPDGEKIKEGFMSSESRYYSSGCVIILRLNGRVEERQFWQGNLRSC